MLLNKLRWKNFLSYGQNWTELNLNNNLINIIMGKNGKGKSSAIGAVTYVLTGKPYRNINKAQLVNSINKKGLLVELFFTSGSHEYMIRRGIKPNIFEIYKDNKLLDQSAKVVDYQKVLDDIIKIDLKTLKQSIIMSNKCYKPFLEMTKAEKRFYVEEILNIKMFSIMSDKVKILNRQAKSEFSFFEKDIERIDSNVVIIKEMKEKYAQQNEVRVNEILKEITKSEKHIKDASNQISTSEIKIDELQEKYDKHKDKFDVYKNIEKKIYQQENEIKRVEKDIAFLSSNDQCNSCHQSITAEYKKSMVAGYQANIKNIDWTINMLKTKKDKIAIVIYKLNKLEEHINRLKSERLLCDRVINSEESNIRKYKKEINALQIQHTIPFGDNEIQLLADKKKISKKINKTQKNIQYYTILLKLLADDGIKRYIVKKYLNVFNNYVNKYLDLLHTSYRMEFNDEFEERIIANGYEKLQYGSFSGGERQRLDLAILFTFLELAKNRNSVNCNVLFLDEMADIALDAEGISGMFKILTHLKQSGYTIFIISHTEGVKDYCDVVYEAQKKTFSNLVEIG